MEQKLNSNSSDGTAADSDMQPIINSSADIAVNPVLPAALSEGNKLIADFMGVKIGIDNYSWRIGCIEPLQEKHLNYHSSWGWLMPVVEKIEDNCKAHITIYNKQCWVEFYGIHDDPCKFHNKEKSTIENVWLSIVSFIEWYNQQGVSEGSR